MKFFLRIIADILLFVSAAIVPSAAFFLAIVFIPVFDKYIEALIAAILIDAAYGISGRVYFHPVFSYTLVVFLVLVIMANIKSRIRLHALGGHF